MQEVGPRVCITGLVRSVIRERFKNRGLESGMVRKGGNGSQWSALVPSRVARKCWEMPTVS